MAKKNSGESTGIVSEISGLRKAAILLIALDKDAASRVMSRLTAEAVETQ